MSTEGASGAKTTISLLGHWIGFDEPPTAKAISRLIFVLGVLCLVIWGGISLFIWLPWFIKIWPILGVGWIWVSWLFSEE